MSWCPGEEQLPLFAMHFNADDGHKRRLFAGLIPVGRREAYVGAAQRTPSQLPGTQPATVGTGVPATVAPTDPRMVLLS